MSKCRSLSVKGSWTALKYLTIRQVPLPERLPCARASRCKSLCLAGHKPLTHLFSTQCMTRQHRARATCVSLRAVLGESSTMSVRFTTYTCRPKIYISMCLLMYNPYVSIRIGHYGSGKLFLCLFYRPVELRSAPAGHCRAHGTTRSSRSQPRRPH